MFCFGHIIVISRLHCSVFTSWHCSLCCILYSGQHHINGQVSCSICICWLIAVYMFIYICFLLQHVLPHGTLQTGQENVRRYTIDSHQHRHRLNCHDVRLSYCGRLLFINFFDSSFFDSSLLIWNLKLSLFCYFLVKKSRTHAYIHNHSIPGHDLVFPLLYTLRTRCSS